jgi:hypothetical protein
MIKRHSSRASVGLAIAFATAALLSGLAGCSLYFGNDSKSGNGDGRPPGAECQADNNCAAGCFCQNGTCTEAGFCGGDKDCGAGFHCDIARSSCVPNPVCANNDACPQGQICTNKACVATCTCSSDAEAIMKGQGFCDLNRKTCMPGSNPAGICGGMVTCTTRSPVCAEGQVALIKDGCFTGECRAIAACEAPPACNSLQHQTDCATRATDCSVVTIGHGCRRPDGTACQAGDTNCVCDSYSFSSCEIKTTGTPRVIFN